MPESVMNDRNVAPIVLFGNVAYGSPAQKPPTLTLG